MKPIHNASGAVIGYENDISDYRKEIRSRSNSLLGFYNPKDGPQGKTFTATGRCIGHGDQRMRLLPMDG